MTELAKAKARGKMYINVNAARILLFSALMNREKTLLLLTFESQNTLDKSSMFTKL